MEQCFRGQIVPRGSGTGAQFSKLRIILAERSCGSDSIDKGRKFSREFSREGDSEGIKL